MQIYIYIYIYIFKQTPTFNVLLYALKKHIVYLIVQISLSNPNKVDWTQHRSIILIQHASKLSPQWLCGN